MVKSENNPNGLPTSVFGGIHANVAANRSQFYKDLAVPFYGFDRPNAKISQGTIDEFWREAPEPNSFPSEDDLYQHAQSRLRLEQRCTARHACGLPTAIICYWQSFVIGNLLE
jgi:hypothetical protein